MNGPDASGLLRLVNAIVRIGDQWFVTFNGHQQEKPYSTRADAIRALARLDEGEEAELRG
jgi:hypothetical protein